jgi:hypothetical protein
MLRRIPWSVCACSAVRFWLYVCANDDAAQVYGGSMSFVVGAYLWSNSFQYDSSCTAGETVVSGFSMVLNNNRISGSQAVTSTIGGALHAPNPNFPMYACARMNFIHSIRTQVLLWAPM